MLTWPHPGTDWAGLIDEVEPVFLDIAKAVFILDTPGPTPATVRSVDFKNLRRPYFPLDVEIPGLTPTILQ